MANYYLARWAGTGTDIDPFRVPGATTVIDLRPDPTLAGGYAFATGPVEAAYVAVDLGTDPVGRLNNKQRRDLSSALGYNVADYPLNQVVADLLLAGYGAGRTKLVPGRDSKYRVRLGELSYEQPVVAGGAVITESFDKADSTVVGADLSWAELANSGATWPAFNRNNQVHVDHSGSTRGMMRAESDLTTDNHYAQHVSYRPGGNNKDTNLGPAVRLDPTMLYANGTSAHCYAFVRTRDNRLIVRKMSSGTITDLYTATDTGLADGAVWRLEADGSTITALIDGVVRHTVTDTAITGYKRAGFFGFLGGSTGVTSQLVADSFEAGDLGAAPVTITPTGIPSTSSVGVPSVAPGPVTISPAGITSTTVVGTSTVEPAPVTITPAGIGSTSAVGSVAVAPGPVSFSPAGVTSTTAVGAPTLTPGSVTLSPAGIPSTTAVGVPSVAVTVAGEITPAGIPSSTAVGVPTLTPGPVSISPAGIPSSIAVGSVSVAPGPVTISPAGIPSTTAVGATSVSAVIPGAITPTGIPSTTAVGSVTVTPGSVTISPAGVPSTTAVGAPTVAVPAAQTISPAGIASTTDVGLTVVTPGPVSLSPAGVPSTTTVGGITVAAGPVTILLAGIASTTTVGASRVSTGKPFGRLYVYEVERFHIEDAPHEWSITARDHLEVTDDIHSFHVTPMDDRWEVSAL